MLAPLAGCVALSVLLGVAAFVIFNRETGCAAEKLALRVVTAPEIRPAVQRVAQHYNGSEHRVDGRCVTLTVTEESPAKTAEAVAAGAFSAHVWIADSSLWLEQLAIAESASPPRAGASVARSPIVLAASAATAGKLKERLRPSWAGMIKAADVVSEEGLAGQLRVLALDPKRNATGLGALLAASGAAQAAGTEEKALVGALKRLSRGVVAGQEPLLASLTVRSGARMPVGVASEQSVWAHNTRKPDAPIVPLYPEEGTLSLDYPFLLTTPDTAAREAAAGFAKELGGRAARQTLHEYGFRSPDGAGGSALATARGFTAESPKALPPPDGGAVARVAQSWNRLNLGTRLLALLDVSGTMAYPVPGTDPPMTRMQVIAKTALGGLSIYDAKDEIGAWAFSTHLDGRGKDYKELVSVGPLGESIDGVLRRDRLAEVVDAARATPGDTGLNDTLKAAYGAMVEGYQDDKINVLLALTDGAGNDDPDGGVSDAEILAYLKKNYDPARPVNLLIIAFGPDAPKGKAQMDALAEATGGEAFIVKDPLGVREVFLKGMARRLCAPRCDG